MIERDFDVPFIAELARREKQIQQNYRPLIAVHKWFARRPGTLFRGLLLAEYGDRPVAEAFYRHNEFPGLLIADPFMGGGTPLVEANRVGCNVIGCDINPMAYWIVREQIEPIDLTEYDRSVKRLRGWLDSQVGSLYRTRCIHCGTQDVPVKYFLWVKTVPCRTCGTQVDLFPGYIVAKRGRHPNNVLLCAGCGALNERSALDHVGDCDECGEPLHIRGPAGGGTVLCPACNSVTSYPRPATGPPTHRMFAIEYHCAHCSRTHKGRFFKRPDEADLQRLLEAASRLDGMELEYAPADEIPPGDETDRLHRWGYRTYRDMFNVRQLLGLELSCRAIAAHPEDRIRAALATNLSDLLRYQNMLCRYDSRALKSLDIFSVHGFPVGLVQCESNLLGIPKGNGRANIGSGGWSNIADKYATAKEYCTAPYEIRHRGSRKVKVPIKGEWIGRGDGANVGKGTRGLSLRCGSSTELEIPQAALDGVFTDPPYLGNVQYAELMDFCYVWLRRLVPEYSEAFVAASTRSPLELTANATMERGLAEYAEGVAKVFSKMAHALKPGAPLVFTFHHNSLTAYHAIAFAILDAGLLCTGSPPCPAEMGASIHINGTGSSVVDTIFVCRDSIPAGVPPVSSVEALQAQITEDTFRLEASGLQVSVGDLLCVAYGHVTRYIVQRLHHGWNREESVEEKLQRVSATFHELPDVHQLLPAHGGTNT